MHGLILYLDCPDVLEEGGSCIRVDFRSGGVRVVFEGLQYLDYDDIPKLYASSSFNVY